MIIEATGLTKEFARARGGKRLFTAVHPLDIGLEERQLTVVSGHSGSGKSTLANMLAGILTPTVSRFPVVTYGTSSFFCTIIVIGPGQNRSIRRSMSLVTLSVSKDISSFDAI